MAGTPEVDRWPVRLALSLPPTAPWDRSVEGQHSAVGQSHRRRQCPQSPCGAGGEQEAGWPEGWAPAALL